MKNKYVKIISMLALSLFSFSANAWTWNVAQNKTITDLEVLDHGGFVVWFDTEVSTTCTSNGTKSVFFYSGQHYVTDAGVKSLLSGALTALTTGMKVDIVYDNGDSYCWGRYIKLKK